MAPIVLMVRVLVETLVSKGTTARPRGTATSKFRRFAVSKLVTVAVKLLVPIENGIQIQPVFSLVRVVPRTIGERERVMGLLTTLSNRADLATTTACRLLRACDIR